MRNFKGGDQSVPLEGLDILVGENGTGKTRIIQAVQLALTGQVPHAIEERNIDTMELVTKGPNVGSMEVILATDDQEFPGVGRMFTVNRKNGKDSLSQLIALLPDGYQPPTEPEKKIRETIGDFPVMLDVHKFIRMSDQDRAKLIFSFCPVDIEKWNLRTIVDRLREVCKHEKCDLPLTENVLADIALPIKSNDALPASVLATLLTEAKAKESTLKKEEKNNAGSALASIQLNANDGKRSLRNVVDIKADIINARADETALVQKIAESRSTQKAIARLEGERKQLADQIVKERERVKPERIEEFKKDIENERAHLIDTKDQEQLIADSTSKRQSFRVEEQVSANLIQNADLDIGNLTAMIASLKSGTCPTCGQASAGTVAELEARLERFAGERAEYAKEHAELQYRILRYGDELASLVAKVADTQKSNHAIIETIRGNEAEITRLEGASEGIKSLEKRLEELNHTYPAGASINLAEAEINLEATRARIKSLESEAHEKQEYDTKIALAKEAAAKAKKAEESLAIVKVLIKQIQAIRFEIVRESLLPVSAEAAELFSVVAEGQIKAKFAFQFEDSRGNEVFQFGWVIDGPLGEIFIDFDSLSTAQQAFTLVALLAPLIHRGNPQLRILLLDNIEIVSEQYRGEFLSMLQNTIGRYLDNVIVASSSPFPTVVGGTVHQLYAMERVAA